MRILMIAHIILFLPCVVSSQRDWKAEGELLLKDRNGITKGEQLELAGKGLEMGAKAINAAVEIGGLAVKAAENALSTGDLAGAACAIPNIIGSAVNSVFDFIDGNIKQKRAQQKRERDDRQFKEALDEELKQDEKIEGLVNNVDGLIDETLNQMSQLNKSLQHNNILIKEISTSLTNFDVKVTRQFDEMKQYLMNLYDDTMQTIQLVDEKIAKDFERLDNKIRHHFLELSQLTVHLQFTEEIILDTDLLENLMIQVMNFNRNDTIADFVRQYNIKGPRLIILDLTNRLRYKYANPIIAAMELHIFESGKILDFWRNHISSVILKLLTVEGFYYGLIEVPKKTNRIEFLEPINDAVNELFLELNAFSKNLEIDSTAYWPDAITFNVGKIVERQKDGNTTADEIHKLLNGIYTNDIFTIHVAKGNYENTANAAASSYINPTRFQKIDDEQLYAMSPSNEKGHITQLTFINYGLAVSIVRSATYHKRKESETFMLNEAFDRIYKDNKYISNHERFHQFVNKLNEDMGGVIGGAVISNEHVAERVTNQRPSPLEWYNQVPEQGKFVNLMWI